MSKQKQQPSDAVRAYREQQDATYQMLRAFYSGEPRRVQGTEGLSAYIAAPLSPTGGYVMVVWRCKGQQDQLTCYYLESWTGQMRHYQANQLRSDDREMGAYCALAARCRQAMKAWQEELEMAQRLAQGEGQ